MSDSDPRAPLPDPDSTLDLDKLLRENPDVDERQIRELHKFLHARRGEGRRTAYRLDSPYQRGYQRRSRTKP
jgi:hypothetical protein